MMTTNERILWAVAVHEAGHAAAAEAVGVPFREAAIFAVPAFVPGRGVTVGFVDLAGRDAHLSAVDAAAVSAAGVAAQDRVDPFGRVLLRSHPRTLALTVGMVAARLGQPVDEARFAAALDDALPPTDLEQRDRVDQFAACLADGRVADGGRAFQAEATAKAERLVGRWEHRVRFLAAAMVREAMAAGVLTLMPGPDGWEDQARLAARVAETSRHPPTTRSAVVTAGSIVNA